LPLSNEKKVQGEKHFRNDVKDVAHYGNTMGNFLDVLSFPDLVDFQVRRRDRKSK
jgi:hypothetical protein